MWKLTIKQGTKDSYITDKVSFCSENVVDLTIFIEKLATFQTDINTCFKIEKVGAENE